MKIFFIEGQYTNQGLQRCNRLLKEKYLKKIAKDSSVQPKDNKVSDLK